MGEEQMSPERQQAHLKMREALQLAKGRHPERGLEAMKETIRLDPTYMEPRHWLASYYRERGQDRLAVEEYEEILRLEPDNEEAWAALSEMDPGAEQRLRRLHDVAPDPFVARRAAAASSEFADLAEGDEDYVETAEVEEGVSFGARKPLDAGVFADDEAEAEAYGEPLPWEHEQDREYRDKLEASQAFVALLDGFALLWDDERAWEVLLEDCEEPAAVGWAELTGLMDRAARALDAAAPRVLVCDDPLGPPAVLPLAEATIVVGSDSRDRFSEREVVFWLGSACHDLLGAAAEYVWACEEVLQREVPEVGIRSSVPEAAQEHIEGWDKELPEQECKSLRALAHAWEQRAVLSADRAGLLAAGDEAIARRAIAAAVAEREVAAEITSTEFLSQFRHLKPAELAAVGVQESPWTSPQYAAYRSKVIHWWATTDECKALSSG